MAWLGKGASGPREVRAARLPSGFFRAAFEHANDAMLAVSDDGRVLGANGAVCTLFDLPREQLTRKKLGELVRRGAKPARREDSGEGAFTRADGRERACEIIPRGEIAPGLHLVVLRERGEAAPLEAHLCRADRLSTFGMLAVGVAHEINNPLMYAMTNLRAALHRMPELVALAREKDMGELAAALEQSTRMLATADEGMDRIGALVRDLRVASHEGAERARVDVRQVLESCLNIAHGEIRQRARLVREYAPGTMVEGHPGRLGQVFLNLLVNAAQAMPPSPARAGLPGPAAPSRPAEIRVLTRSVDDARLAVEISDNGLGIPREAMDRIFDPFFTTKPAGEGTGLGLYIARAIVHEHGGRIEVESTPGQGTTMRVILPKVPVPPSVRGPV